MSGGPGVPKYGGGQFTAVGVGNGVDVWVTVAVGPMVTKFGSGVPKRFTGRENSTLGVAERLELRLQPADATRRSKSMRNGKEKQRVIRHSALLLAMLEWQECLVGAPVHHQE